MASRAGVPASGVAMPGSIEQLMAAKDVAVFCGSGGVGKTTGAAAVAAMVAVHQGGKVLVLTVDPAKRLANALGLEGFGNVEKEVPASAFASAGVKPRGELWAAMLDTKQSWDNLVRRHAPDKATAAKILSNPLYQNISGRFVQSHDYIAMERLYELHCEGNYDLIVVDTPPTRNAIDFLEAPERMADFFSSRFLRMLTAPARSRFVNMATKPFYQVADRILGSQFLQDVSEFFLLFQTMYDGFVERARSVERLLHDRRTTFVVVSTLESAPVDEAEFFIRSLSSMEFHLGALVLNKVLPAYLLDPVAFATAEDLEKRSAEVAADLAPLFAGAGGAAEPDEGAEGAPAEPHSEAQVARVLVEMAESFRRFHVVAQREAEERSELAAAPDVVATVPYFDTDIHDLAGLLRLGETLWT